MLGLISTKNNAVETADELKRRIDEAAKYGALDRLCLSAAMRLLVRLRPASPPDLTTAAVRKLQRMVEVDARSSGDA